MSTRSCPSGRRCCDCTALRNAFVRVQQLPYSAHWSAASCCGPAAPPRRRARARPQQRPRRRRRSTTSAAAAVARASSSAAAHTSVSLERAQQLAEQCLRYLWKPLQKVKVNVAARSLAHLQRACSLSNSVAGLIRASEWLFVQQALSLSLITMPTSASN